MTFLSFVLIFSACYSSFCFLSFVQWVFSCTSLWRLASLTFLSSSSVASSLPTAPFQDPLEPCSHFASQFQELISCAPCPFLVDRGVFLDSDRLKDLNLLFRIVGKKTETFVILCCREILHRPG